MALPPRPVLCTPRHVPLAPNGGGAVAGAAPEPDAGASQLMATCRSARPGPVQARHRHVARSSRGAAVQSSAQQCTAALHPDKIMAPPGVRHAPLRKVEAEAGIEAPTAPTAKEATPGRATAQPGPAKPSPPRHASGWLGRLAWPAGLAGPDLSRAVAPPMDFRPPVSPRPLRYVHRVLVRPDVPTPGSRPQGEPRGPLVTLPAAARGQADWALRGRQRRGPPRA